jgi:hypothetical protein
MQRSTGMTTLAVGLLALFLLASTVGSAEAQMCAMGGQGGSPGQPSGQPPMMGGGMMGGGMMGQGMCPMCMMQSMAPRMGESKEPMGMMGMMGMMGEGQMDAKTRGQLLQMRGEMFKAMGEVMLKHGQALGQTQ